MIVVGIRYMLVVFAVRKLLFDLSCWYSMSVNNVAGQNPSLRCSHTLSLTAENMPTMAWLPDHSKVKCRMVPRVIMKIIPVSSYVRVCFVLFIVVHGVCVWFVLEFIWVIHN